MALSVLLYKLVSVCITLSQSPGNFTEKLKLKIVFKIQEIKVSNLNRFHIEWAKQIKHRLKTFLLKVFFTVLI